MNVHADHPGLLDNAGPDGVELGGEGSPLSLETPLLLAPTPHAEKEARVPTLPHPEPSVSA